MSGDGVGCLDEGPFEVLVALGSHLAVVSLASAGADPWGGTAVAGELRGGREAGDGADFPIDEDGQDVAHPGEALEKLHARGDGDAASDAPLESTDLSAERIEDLQML
jgi:hypothetical protein